MRATALLGSNIFLMVPATQAASRLTMNSKPSFEMRVTKGEVEAVMVARVWRVRSN